MVRQRPPAVTAIAVLNLVLGGLALVVSLYGALNVLYLLVMIPMLQTPGTNTSLLQELPSALTAVPGLLPFLIADTTLACCLAVGLFVAGFGLLRLRRWGRWATTTFAVCWAATAVAALGYAFAVVRPAMLAWAAENAQTAGLPGLVGDPVLNNPQILVVRLFVLAYGIAAAVVLFRPSVSAAFTDPGAPGAEREEPYGPAARVSGEDE